MSRPENLLKNIDKTFEHLLEAQELIHTMDWSHRETARALADLVTLRIDLAVKQLLGSRNDREGDRDRLRELTAAVTYAAANDDSTYVDTTDSADFDTDNYIADRFVGVGFEVKRMIII